MRTRIRPVAAQKIERETSEGTVNVLTRKNYRYLLRSARNYARLIGRTLEHHPGHSLCESIANLYRELNQLLPDLRVNIEVHECRPIFCLYSYHKWPNYTLHWLPVSFIDHLGGKLKRLSITFIHQLARSNGMSYQPDWGDLEWALDWMGESVANGELDKTERKAWRGLIRSYHTGHAHILLERVRKRSYYKRLAQALKRYQPIDAYETRLHALLVEGLRFIGIETPSIMHYLYDPYYDSGEEDMICVDFDRILRVVYDVDDAVSENLTELLNNEMGGSDYVVTPATALYLTPELTQPFAMDDYPECFSNWVCRFVEFVSTLKP